MRSKIAVADLAFYFLIPLIAVASLPYNVSDLACWIALGLKTISTGQLQTIDTFSVFSTAPVIYPSWSLTLLYARLYSWLGLEGLAAIHQVIPFTVLFWIYRRSVFRVFKHQSLVFKTATYVSWVSLISLFGERPSVVALLFLVCTLDQVFRVRKKITGRQLLIFSMIEIFWVNVHGSFLLLPFLLMWRIFWLNFKNLKNFVRSGLAVVTLFLVVGANPFGYSVYKYVFETANFSRERGITEWDRTLPWTQFPQGLLLYISALFLIIFLTRLWNQKKQEKFFHALSSPFAALIFIGFFAIRNAPLFSLALLPFLMIYSRSLSKTNLTILKIKANQAPKVVISIVLIVLYILLLPPFKSYLSAILPESRQAVLSEDAPIELVKKISREQPGCAVFSEMEISGTLMLLTPHPIFIDTRNIIYSAHDFEQAVGILRGQGNWQAFLAEKNTCYILVDEKRHLKFSNEVKASDQWCDLGTEQSIRLFEKCN